MDKRLNLLYVYMCKNGFNIRFIDCFPGMVTKSFFTKFSDKGAENFRSVTIGIGKFHWYI